MVLKALGKSIRTELKDLGLFFEGAGKARDKWNSVQIFCTSFETAETAQNMGAIPGLFENAEYVWWEKNETGKPRVEDLYFDFGVDRPMTRKLEYTV